MSTVWANVPAINELAPPTPEAYTFLITVFQYFPLVSNAP